MSAQFSILLVDDDPAIADILNRTSESIFPQAQFIHVSSFVQAAAYLDGLEGRGPRLILLDINLQTGLSGLEFLTLIRQHPLGHLLPVVILSTTRRQEEIKEAYIRGANAFTVKPFSYGDWKAYVTQLRIYWFETATIPKPWFEKENNPE
jgi:CheY-like chemotaxis protein